MLLKVLLKSALQLMLLSLTPAANGLSRNKQRNKQRSSKLIVQICSRQVRAQTSKQKQTKTKKTSKQTNCCSHLYFLLKNCTAAAVLKLMRLKNPKQINKQTKKLKADCTDLLSPVRSSNKQTITHKRQTNKQIHFKQTKSDKETTQAYKHAMNQTIRQITQEINKQINKQPKSNQDLHLHLQEPKAHRISMSSCVCTFF